MSSGQNTEVCLQAKVSGHQEKKKTKQMKAEGGSPWSTDTHESD